MPTDGSRAADVVAGGDAVGAGAHRLTTVASGLAAVVGALTIVGWVTGNVALMSVLPGLVPMNPLTALCFAAAGVSMWLLRDPAAATSRAGRVLALAVLLVGLVRLGGDVAGWRTAIDQVLFREALLLVPHAPNRMAPNTAVGFVLIGLALLLLDVETRGGRRPAQHLALAAGVVSVLTMTGYGYGEPRLIAVPSFLPMALNTAAGFAILATGILWARVDDGFMRIVTSTHPGGATARRLLPAAIAVPWALGWIQLYGNRAGLYAHEAGVAIFAVATMIILGTAVSWAAHSVEQADRARREAQDALAASEARLRAILDNTTALISLKDRDGRLLFVNRRFEEVVNLARERVMGLTDHDLFPAELADTYRANDLEVLTARTPIEFEEPVPHADGVHTYVSIKFPLAAAGEEPYALCAISTDITTRKRMEHVLEERTTALEAANHELEAFSYSVSHDLRAPLRAIDGFAHILVDDHGTRLDDEGHRVLDVICQNARQMGRLIDDLLALSRLGRRTLDRRLVDMRALAETVVAEVRQLDRGREGAAVTIEPLPPVAADSGMMHQVMANLVGNAWKFTAGTPDAAITIGASVRERETVYFVKDNGAGFNPVYAAKLFGVFQRLHSTEEFEGTGIGLATVRRIVERHGGRVWADGAVGRGATFFFALPAAAIRSEGVEA